MKVLLVGNGGREDALAWAIRRSPLLTSLHCAPGSAGLSRRAETVAVDAGDVPALLRHVRKEPYDLVIVGPEAPLVAGLADRLDEIGVPVFGPVAAAARIEGSKVFAKEFMTRHGIPTADYRVFDDAASAREHLTSSGARFPTVIKADGLAAGKGVVIAESADEAIAAVEAMMVERRFGEAGGRVLVEELLRGREASFFVLSDGERFVELATCQDYKRVGDADRGPNTGGMGTYSPSAYLSVERRRELVDSVVRPTIEALAAAGSPYRGVLYVGVMLTDEGPRVLEYNARFGDPETQVLLPRLRGDWLALMHACATGRLASVDPPRWREEAAVCVVMASEGYPAGYAKGRVIEGIETADAIPGVEVFHAGTARDGEGRWVTSGGRVLGVTALGRDLADARERAYDAVAQIRWTGEHHRDDIALDAVRRLAEETS